MKLYKYRKLDERSLSIIQSGELWFSSPETFNDPYDCQLYIDPEGTHDEWQSFFIGTFKQLPKYKDQPDKAVEEIVEKILRETPYDKERDQAERALQSIVKEVRQQIGVCCLSSVNNSIPMWSHYADSHKGICLEFESEKDTLGGLKNFIQVKYYEQYPEISIQKTPPEKMGIEIATSKAAEWSYEQEYRLFEKQPGPKKVALKSLTGIIFGCQCLTTEIEKVKKIINKRTRTPTLYRAETIKNRFEIRIVPL